MKSISLIIIALAMLVGLCASQSTCDGVTISQTLRTTWVSDGVTYYLYDLTITNDGLTSIDSAQTPLIGISSDAGSISQTWNLVTYASTVPHLTFVGTTTSTTIAPGASYTSAGYVFAGSQTTVACEADQSSDTTPSTTAASTTAASAPSTTAASAASTTAASAASTTASSSTTGSAACSSVRVTQTLVSTWVSGGTTYYEYDLTLTNTGSTTVDSAEAPLISISSDSGNISQTWNLVTYASATAHVTFVGVTTGTTIAPGASYTSAGYVFEGSATEVTGVC